MAHPSALERLKKLAKADREAAQGFYIVCGKPAVEDFDPVWEKEDPEWFERHQELLFIIALMEGGTEGGEVR